MKEGLHPESQIAKLLKEIDSNKNIQQLKKDKQDELFCNGKTTISSREINRAIRKRKYSYVGSSTDWGKAQK